MLIGYARVSTEDQNFALQLDALAISRLPLNFSRRGRQRRDRNRAALNGALAVLAPAMCSSTWKLDRFGRSLAHLIEIIAPPGQGSYRLPLSFRGDRHDDGRRAGCCFTSWVPWPSLSGPSSASAPVPVWRRPRPAASIWDGGGRSRTKTLCGPSLTIASGTATPHEVARALQVAPLTLRRSLQRLETI